MHRHHHDSQSESNQLNSRRYRNSDDYEDYASNRSNHSSQSPVRDESYLNDELCDQDVTLRLKWMDNSPRMSRIRENRQKRLINKLEVDKTPKTSFLISISKKCLIIHLN